MNILIVDDNPTNRLLLKYMIEGEGYSITEADDGDVSVELVKDKRYDLIFMDMMMPRMNGYVATKHIKKIDNTIPVYIVSAYKKIDFPADWQNVDYEDVLEKPVSLDTIMDIINKHKV